MLEGLLSRDPTRKAIIKGKTPKTKKKTNSIDIDIGEEENYCVPDVTITKAKENNKELKRQEVQEEKQQEKERPKKPK